MPMSPEKGRHKYNATLRLSKVPARVNQKSSAQLQALAPLWNLGFPEWTACCIPEAQEDEQQSFLQEDAFENEGKGDGRMVV